MNDTNGDAMKTHLVAAILIASAVTFPALADDAHHKEAIAAAVSSGDALADGEVRKVDKDAKKLTIRHGPLPQLDMPTPMTMVYQVKDPALLDQVKAGDKIRFVAEKIGGQFTVMRIEPAK
jgi:Cu(I)/Ag(I) efflux system protein CusF